MDYDRYDAILHYIFKQTQGDAWFRPDARDIAAGVCLRDESGRGAAWRGKLGAWDWAYTQVGHRKRTGPAHLETPKWGHVDA